MFPSASASMDSQKSPAKKRVKYGTYSTSDRARIGKSTVENGPAFAI